MDRLTLEQALDEAFEKGNESQLLFILKLLPSEKQEKYRKLWKELSKKRDQKPKETACQHGIDLKFRCWDCDPKEQNP